MRQSRWLGPSLAVGHARERRRGAGARGSSGAKASGVTTPRRSMTCSPASRRSGRRSASRPVGRERGAGGAMTSTPSTCSWASSFLTLGPGATSATWPSSAGPRPLTSPTARPVWRGEGAVRTLPGGRIISLTNAGTLGVTSATKPARACGRSGQDGAVSCVRRSSRR